MTSDKPALDDLLGALGQPPAQTPSSTPSNLADLLGSSAPTTSTSSAGALADLMSQPTPSSSPQFEPITAFEKDGIRVVFRLSKPAGQDSVTDIEALYSNSSGQPITDFSLQVCENPAALLCCDLCATCESQGTIIFGGIRGNHICLWPLRWTMFIVYAA